MKTARSVEHRAHVAVLLADGFEEIEAISVIDVLRRAGLTVSAVGVHGARATGSHAIEVACDTTLDALDVEAIDWIVLPGGMPGARVLAEDARVQALLRAHDERGRALAAICAAPMALGRAGLLRGKRATCFPGFEHELTGADVDARSRVVVDGRVITSRGPGTALEFALAIVRATAGDALADKLTSGMLVRAEA